MKKRIITGIAILAPIGITFYIFYLIIKLVAGILYPIVSKIEFLKGYPVFANYLISFVVAIFILWFLGFTASSILGRAILKIVDRILEKAPFINKVSAFKKVALIEYPRRGIKTLAFITGEFEIKKKKHFAVFVPTTPNPTSGFFIILPKEDVVITDMSVEQAMKVIISGGMIKPENLDKILDKNV